MENLNRTYLTGTVISEPTPEYIDRNGNDIFKFKIAVLRNSGVADHLDCMVAAQHTNNLFVGKRVSAMGQIRTLNIKGSDGKSHVALFLDVDSLVTENVPNNDSNEVVFTGYVCKKPVLRKTSFRETKVADVIFAVNGNYTSSYVPCVAWNNTADFLGTLQIGDEVTATGRFQSRIYIKKHDNGVLEEKMAYEIALYNVSLGQKAYGKEMGK